MPNKIIIKKEYEFELLCPKCKKCQLHGFYDSLLGYFLTCDDCDIQFQLNKGKNDDYDDDDDKNWMTLSYVRTEIKEEKEDD